MKNIETYEAYGGTEKASRFWPKASKQMLREVENKASNIVTSLLLITGWEPSEEKFAADRDGLLTHLAGLERDIADFNRMAKETIKDVKEKLKTQTRYVPLPTR